MGDDVEEPADLRLEAMTFGSHDAFLLRFVTGSGADMRKKAGRFKRPGPADPSIRAGLLAA